MMNCTNPVLPNPKGKLVIVRFILLGCFSICVIAILLSCRASESKPLQVQRIAPSAPSIQAATEIDGVLHKRKAVHWTVTETSCPCEARSLIFLTKGIGYVSDNRNLLFKTIDGGKSWTRVGIAIPDGAEISNISFVSPEQGWVSLISSPSEEERSHKQLDRYPPLYPWLWQTKDGGTSWQRVMTEHPMIIREIQFVTEQEGWAWGTRIYHTKDQGLHWEDILDGLCRLAPHQHLDDCPFYSVLGEVNGQAVVLTNDLLVGGVGITNDVGKNWQLRSILKLNPFGYTEPVKIKRGANQSLWFVTSTDSREGMSGQLIHIGQDNSVHNYHFGVVITDAIFLRGNQILASGYQYPTNRIRDFDKRIGIILSSRDGGMTWDFVYNNKKVKSINALQVTTENQVWAIGEKGLILKLVQNKPERHS